MLNAKVRNNEDGTRIRQSNQSSVISNQSAAAKSVALGADAVQQRAEIRDQRSEKTAEIPELRGDFVPQTAGGELVTSQDCPEFVGGDDRRADGVKAVEDDRSPSPGGTTERPRADEHPGGLRQGVSAAGGDLAGVSEIPELSLASSAEAADGEKVTNVEKPICPSVARRNERVATRDRRGREPAAAVACHALIGLGDGWGRLTWACARRTRFSPGHDDC